MTQKVIAPGEPLAAEPKRRKKVREKAPKGRWFQEVGWRHLVGVVAVLVGTVPDLLHRLGRAQPARQRGRPPG